MYHIMKIFLNRSIRILIIRVLYRVRERVGQPLIVCRLNITNYIRSISLIIKLNCSGLMRPLEAYRFHFYWPINLGNVVKLKLKGLITTFWVGIDGMRIHLELIDSSHGSK